MLQRTIQVFTVMLVITMNEFPMNPKLIGLKIIMKINLFSTHLNMIVISLLIYLTLQIRVKISL